MVTQSLASYEVMAAETRNLLLSYLAFCFLKELIKFSNHFSCTASYTWVSLSRSRLHVLHGTSQRFL